ncbi:MAG: DUF3617 family protein [Candidatus Dadabacteria bacterium]|nr:DUF3617 family protein [Candidatus Dadabacteria bacterium]
MIYKLHVKAGLVMCFIIFGVVGCKQEQQNQQDLSLPMKAGAYDVSVTQISYSLKDPRIRNVKRCFKEPFFDPFKLYHDNDNCKVTNINKGADNASFDIVCKGQGGKAKGRVKYSVKGDKLYWSSKLSKIKNKKMKV